MGGRISHLTPTLSLGISGNRLAGGSLDVFPIAMVTWIHGQVGVYCSQCLPPWLLW